VFFLESTLAFDSNSQALFQKGYGLTGCLQEAVVMEIGGVQISAVLRGWRHFHR
jgi:hypothetical protein